MSPSFHCTMYAYSTSPHVSQLYTGFSILAQQGHIKLKQRLSQYSVGGKTYLSYLRPHCLNGVFVTLNDGPVLFYDTSDRGELYEEALRVSDFYFKRSYLPSTGQHQHGCAVFPLGMNYEIYCGTPCPYEWARFLMRADSFHNFPKVLLRRMAELAFCSFLPRTRNMYAAPTPSQDPRVLFMARAWDPDHDPVGLPLEIKEDRRRVNDMRALCITLIKKELGQRFYGGFIRTDYAEKHFKDLLLDDNSTSAKRNYISMLRKFPICIATMGLHGSIGWKMAEYVCFSKSIVSEKLKYQVPGGFEKDKNYLEFTTPQMCLEQSMKLMEDKNHRQKLMEANWDYYRTYLSPDKLILRTLNIAAGCCC